MKTYRIDELCTVKSSKRIFANQYVSNGIPFFRGKEITALANRSPIDTPLYINKNTITDLKKYGLPCHNDILITAVGTIGSVWLVDVDYDFYFKDGNILWLTDFNNNYINNKFMLYLLKSSKCQHNLLQNSIGSTQKALTINSLKNLSIIIPSLLEQQHIVDTTVILHYSILK